MSDPGDFKNNPLYTDITKLDALSPSPSFSYNWNKASGRWDPAAEVDFILEGLSGELAELNRQSSSSVKLLSGISGELSNIHVEVEIDRDIESHRLLSGIHGELLNLGVNDTRSHELLSGVKSELSNIHVDVEIDKDVESHRLLSGVLDSLTNLDVNDTKAHGLLSGLSIGLSNLDVDDNKTHELLSGVIGKLDQIGGTPSDPISGNQSRSKSQQWKLRTKTVSQKIEEDFILMEDIPEELRFGSNSGDCLGQDRNIKDDLFGNYFNNGRKNSSEPEKSHPDFFLHAEYTKPDRCRDSFSTFDSDTQYGLRQENFNASLKNSYELQDYNELYERGLLDHIVIYNHSPYPIQFHTSDRRFSITDSVKEGKDNLMSLDPDMAVKIYNDEAGRVFVKRPHTVSGYSVDYSITYKVPSEQDIIDS